MIGTQHSLDYRESETVAMSRAHIKPHRLVVCTRCPVAMWINALKIVGSPSTPSNAEDIDYGIDEELRCKCAAWGTETWPKFNIGNCDARREAIRAEQANKDDANALDE